MARRPLARHLATFNHLCPMLGKVLALNRAIRWSPVSKCLARHKPPNCSFCGGAMTLERTAYQAAAADSWDGELERTRIILGELTAERELN